LISISINNWIEPTTRIAQASTNADQSDRISNKDTRMLQTMMESNSNMNQAMLYNFSADINYLKKAKVWAEK
jgi:hypothetical protein